MYLEIPPHNGGSNDDEATGQLGQPFLAHKRT